MRLIAIFVTLAVIGLPSLPFAQDVNGVQYPGMLDYGIWPKSKLVDADGHKFRVWFHPGKPFIMIQPTFAGALEGGKFSHLDLSYGCKITDVAPKTKAGATWNAKYLCPEDKIINPADH